MPEAPSGPEPLLTIRNSRRPEQVIDLLPEAGGGAFVTRGLMPLFHVPEVRIEAAELGAALPDYAQVLAFLLETMSMAEDMGLPYAYQRDFEHGGARWRLERKGEAYTLRRVAEAAPEGPPDRARP